MLEVKADPKKHMAGTNWVDRDLKDKEIFYLGRRGYHKQ